MLVVLIMVLGELRSARDSVAATDAKLERAIEASAPVADNVPALFDDTSTLVSESLPGVRDAASFLEYVADNGIDASVALDHLPALERQASTFLNESTVAVQSLSDLLQDVRDQNLVGKASESRVILERLLEVQLATLRTQRASYRTQRASLKTQLRTARKFSRSLDLQRGALQHARSLDNKTGGELPPP
jgi:hypothetical protein